MRLLLIEDERDLSEIIKKELVDEGYVVEQCYDGESAYTYLMMEEYDGAISSLYFIFYAVGQLINGAIGDKIHAKWMISTGLLGAGITNLVFTRLIDTPQAAMIVYAMTGFFLSMI